MPEIPDVRIRKEDFGYTLAFRTGEIGFYDDRAAALLLSGASQSDLDVCRLNSVRIDEHFHLSAPLIVWFEITRSCNLPCRHCYIEAGPVRKDELTTVEALSVLDQLAQNKVFAVVLVGGEPLRRPDFPKLLQHAHHLGLVLAIATNGTYIDERFIDYCPREECIVSISVDGTHFHQVLRKKSTFEEVKSKLLLLKRHSIPAAIMATQTDRNLEELEEIFEFAKDNGFFFGTTPFSPIGRGRRFPQYMPKSNIAARAANLYIKDKRHDVSMMQTVGLCVAKFLDACHNIARTSRREFCGVAMAYIQSDGDVYPCSICSSTGKYRAGNIRNGRFSDIWANAFTDIRSISFNSFSDCKSCPLATEPYYCTSRCPVLGELYTGSAAGCGATDYVKASLLVRTELLAKEGFMLK